MSDPRNSSSEFFIPVNQSTARTRIKVWNCGYRWVIENFTYCPRATGQCLESPSFNVGPNSEQKWRLELYPRGIADEFQDYVSIYLKLLYSIESKTHAKFEISLISESGKKIFASSTAGLFAPFSSRGFKDFAKRDIIFRTTPESQTVTVHCEISASVETRNFPGVDEVRLTMPRFFLPERMLALLDSGRFSDVVINTGKDEFKVHAAILAANSSKFSAMFHGYEQREPVRIEVKGYDGEVISDLLEFMYAGRIPSFNDDKAEKLLEACNEFSLEELKKMVEDVIKTRINIKTVSHFLLLADKCCARRLKEVCMEYIQNNVAAVLDTDTWKSAAKERPRLADEVATCLARRLAGP